MKSLKDISWDASEEVYRNDSALSYSTLAKYERGGFNCLDTLFDKVENPSLLFGSCVDAIITGGQEEFDSRFFVADFPEISDTIIKIVKVLFEEFHITHNRLSLIPDVEVIGFASRFDYQNNWKPETRAKVIKEKGLEYYNLLYVAQDKTIVSSEMYNDVVNAVNALRESESTKWYFQGDNPFDNSIEKLYQLKFKATLNDIDYRCMFDELVINYKDKTIQPIDLKTSHKKEWDFYKSFIEWNYQIQNRLYVRILQDIISKDDYFKNFTILPYKDIVVCKDSLTPLIWDCPFTFDKGTIKLGKDNQIEMRDPEDIGKELTYYLNVHPNIPIGINIVEGNNLVEWINKM